MGTRCASTRMNPKLWLARTTLLSATRQTKSSAIRSYVIKSCLRERGGDGESDATGSIEGRIHGGGDRAPESVVGESGRREGGQPRDEARVGAGTFRRNLLHECDRACGNASNEKSFFRRSSEGAPEQIGR